MIYLEIATMARNDWGVGHPIPLQGVESLGPQGNLRQLHPASDGELGRPRRPKRQGRPA